MSQPFLEIKDLSFSFAGQPAFEQVSFSVAKGEIVAIIGPNGSGKTTLLKTIIGLYKPAAGSILIDGQNVQLGRHWIGYVPQKFEFDRQIPISVLEFMSLEHCGQKRHGGENISRALQEVGLENVEAMKLGALSGGQFQRVMIARALLHEKDLLIFDEPSTGIDISGEKTIYDLIRTINEQRGTTCLIVSHELNVVNKYAHKVLCLNKQMVCFGQPETVITPETIKGLFGDNAALYHAHKH